ncbi:hypothetical protein BKA70DRAFT_536400 [Coprinopsis sp. MPI-PUGE-AT-0042]|nr:hypothetical protein BKA70DRAFT_536400 [Coprinopsis sp. MPI-PUGE-AT-0042]
MFNDFHASGSSSVITSIPAARFDDRGRQLQFVESPEQQRERLAMLKNKTPNGSPWLTPSSPSRSLSGSPNSSPFSSMIDITSEPFLLSSPPAYANQTIPSSSAKRPNQRRSPSLNSITEED